MSSYYDDPDFADEYRRRDEDAIDFAIREKESDEEKVGLVAPVEPDFMFAPESLPKCTCRPGDRQCGGGDHLPGCPERKP